MRSIDTWVLGITCQGWHGGRHITCQLARRDQAIVVFIRIVPHCTEQHFGKCAVVPFNVFAGKLVAAGRRQYRHIAGRDNRAHIGQAKIKSRLIADLDPDEWDLPPKPKWMRWRTYDRYVKRYNAYEEILTEGIPDLLAKLDLK
jgi:hypothetical protein